MTAEDQAFWCLFTGQSVATYRSLSRIEREAFVAAAKHMRG